MRTLFLGLALFLGSIVSTQAQLVANPPSIEFGSVQIGNQAMHSFMVTNMSMSVVRIYGCNSFDPFECQLTCFGLLQPGQFCTGMIYFTPRSEHYEFENVIIQSSHGSTFISVHGMGVKAN